MNPDYEIFTKEHMLKRFEELGGKTLKNALIITLEKWRAARLIKYWWEIVDREIELDGENCGLCQIYGIRCYRYVWRSGDKEETIEFCPLFKRVCAYRQAIFHDRGYWSARWAIKFGDRRLYMRHSLLIVRALESALAEVKKEGKR